MFENKSALVERDAFCHDRQVYLATERLTPAQSTKSADVY